MGHGTNIIQEDNDMVYYLIIALLIAVFAMLLYILYSVAVLKSFAYALTNDNGTTIKNIQILRKSKVKS